MVAMVAMVVTAGTEELGEAEGTEVPPILLLQRAVVTTILNPPPALAMATATPVVPLVHPPHPSQSLPTYLRPPLLVAIAFSLP